MLRSVGIHFGDAVLGAAEVSLYEIVVKMIRA